jgi:hypothetical protein
MTTIIGSPWLITLHSSLVGQQTENPRSYELFSRHSKTFDKFQPTALHPIKSAFKKKEISL